ncbi:D-amino acid dehydrogenase [Azospirillum sp. sgz301742]
MKIVVLGAGVVGLSAAYFLWRDGHEVTVLDRHPQVCQEASFANGGQLSYSYVAPLASPSVIKDLPELLLHADSPLRFRPDLDPHQWRWCLRFLRACTAEQSRETTARLLTLSFLSRRLMHEVIDGHGLDFAFVRNGKLVVYSTPDSFAGARVQVEYQRRLGCEQTALAPDDCLAVEPALATIRPRLTGGVHTPSEDAGDCHRFCIALARRMERGEAPVRFRLGVTATHFVHDGRRVAGVETGEGLIEADAFVLALGVDSRALALTAGIDLPLYPLKGYSLSAPLREGVGAPKVSITDYARRIVYAPLGGVLRAAGIADIAGFDRGIDERRLGLVTRAARAAFPDAADYDRAEPWCGLRPATPLGTPILGPTSLDNLVLDVGHGALGFTLAMGSGRIVADTMAGRPPAIPLDGFRLD